MPDIYNQIRDTTEDALGLFKQNNNINLSVLECTKNMPSEIAKRVCENVNVSMVLSLFKSGEDKSKEFALADYRKILQKLGREDIDKVEFYKNDIESDKGSSFYSQEEEKGKQKDKETKKAYWNKQKFITKETQEKNEFRKSAYIKKQSEIYIEALLDSRDKMINELHNVKFLLKTASQKKIDTVFSDIYTTYGAKSLPVLKVISDRIGKQGFVKLSSFVDNDAKEYKAIQSIIRNSRWQEMTKTSGGASIPTLWSAVQKTMETATTAKGKISTKKEETKEKPVSFGEGIALGLKYKKIFEELSKRDEILMERNPNALAEIYETMISIAPNVAAEKDIVRSWLRLVSGQPALSHIDAKQLAELEQVFTGKVFKK